MGITTCGVMPNEPNYRQKANFPTLEKLEIRNGIVSPFLETQNKETPIALCLSGILCIT